MITSTQQKNLTLKQIESLNRQLNAKPKPGVPEALVKAHRAQTREEIAELRDEIDQYEAACVADYMKLKFNSYEDMLRAPIIIRLASKLSTEKFAKRVGISESQIKRYEQEEYLNAPGNVVQKILSIFGINITAKAAEYRLQRHA
mgnify:CR=1 FL=1